MNSWNEAYEEGKQAWLNGHDSFSCPYSAFSTETKAWKRGYESEQNKTGVTREKELFQEMINNKQKELAERQE